jgi:hypothetical protein
MAGWPGSHGDWLTVGTFVPAAKPSVSATSVNGGIGNIKSGDEIDLARHGTSITFITIP